MAETNEKPKHSPTPPHPRFGKAKRPRSVPGRIGTIGDEHIVLARGEPTLGQAINSVRPDWKTLDPRQRTNFPPRREADLDVQKVCLANYDICRECLRTNKGLRLRSVVAQVIEGYGHTLIDYMNIYVDLDI
ncbi:MAG: hypothetical protein EXQ91_06275 [Alphaproteobacteria bacterium]|nr:hypothetical protein [Alphaproteobacteria bacterium]